MERLRFSELKFQQSSCRARLECEKSISWCSWQLSVDAFSKTLRKADNVERGTEGKIKGK